MPAAEALFGRNATLEALRARRRRLHRLLVAEAPRGGPLRTIIEEARRAGVPVVETPRRELEGRLATPNANHQGVVLEVGSYPYEDLDAILAGRGARPPLYLALDQLQDPQNVGTLLRTAEAVGVDGILIPEHRAASITPAVVNASSGATEWVRIAPVTNLVRALARLKDAGVWVAGLEATPEAGPIDAADLRGALALVVGSEGSGISRLVRERCDFLVRLPMRGRVASLNAAVAGSIALYAIARQRAE